MATQEQLITDLQQLGNELNKVPTSNEMTQQGEWSAVTYYKYFDSWNEALKEANFETDRTVSKKELITDLEKLADELNKTPTQKEMNKMGEWNITTYQKNFGSWNDALEKASLDVNKTRVVPNSKKELISDLRKLANKLNKTPTCEDMDCYGNWSADVYCRYFNGWNNALEQAGLEINSKRNVSDNKFINELKQLQDKLNKTPTQKEMDKYGKYSSNVYWKKFGSWNNALKKAELDVNIPRDTNTKDSFGEGYHKEREKCYKRDNYRCRICYNYENIHCHHITPRREFDSVSNSNTQDNLITLCASCHNKVEGNWKNSSPDEFADRGKEYIIE